MREFADVAQTSSDVFLFQRRIAVQELFMGPVDRQKIYDHLDRGPRTFDDRFANHDSGVDSNAVTPAILKVPE
jgi:hypothetical protein